MREIKFRFWNITGKTLFYNTQEDDLGWLIAHPKNYHAMQYTGLKDKNGVEIYEGDIVQHHDHLEAVYGIVSWDEEEAAFTPGVGLMSENKSWLEVIGNIYENPELLEAEPLEISERNE